MAFKSEKHLGEYLKNLDAFYEKFGTGTKQTKTIEGYCPLLGCSERETHTHPVCPDCEAVNFGNYYCSTCRGYHDFANKLTEMAEKEEAFSEALWEQGDQTNAHCRAGVAIGLRLAKKVIFGKED